MRTDISSIYESLLTLSGKADYLAGQSRQNNIVIDGIQESQSETWAESEDKVCKLPLEKLQLDHRKLSWNVLTGLRI